MAEHVMENEFSESDRVGSRRGAGQRVGQRSGGQERIWQADPAVWNRHAPVLFPFVGKVNGGVYRYRGKGYEMKTQHGFARDMEFTCVSEREDKLIHRLTSTEETLGKYPFAFTLYITHRFSEENPRELLVSWESHQRERRDHVLFHRRAPGFPRSGGSRARAGISTGWNFRERSIWNICS